MLRSTSVSGSVRPSVHRSVGPLRLFIFGDIDVLLSTAWPVLALVRSLLICSPLDRFFGQFFARFFARFLLDSWFASRSFFADFLLASSSLLSFLLDISLSFCLVILSLLAKFFTCLFTCFLLAFSARFSINFLLGSSLACTGFCSRFPTFLTYVFSRLLIDFLINFFLNSLLSSRSIFFSLACCLPSHLYKYKRVSIRVRGLGGKGGRPVLRPVSWKFRPYLQELRFINETLGS